MEKVLIVDLPVSDQFLRQKRLIQERGELALIEDGERFLHLGYFSLRKGVGYYRGGHYHKMKVEHFYIISGKLRLQLADLDTGRRWETEVHEGQRVRIYPGCAHRFMADEHAQVIEYYDSVYDREDDLPYVDF